MKNLIKSLDALPEVDKRLRRVESLLWAAIGGLAVLQVLIELILRK